MRDKRQFLTDVKARITGGRDSLPPEEYAQAVRELEIFCGKEASHQEKLCDEEDDDDE